MMTNDYSGLAMTFNQLSSETTSEPDWVIPNLIERGDQVILSGAPKAGKSLLCSQLAIALALGRPFLNWPIPARMRVLYVNLEIKINRIYERFSRQLGSNGEAVDIPNLYVENRWRAIDINDTTEHTHLRSYVDRHEIDVVIWDVLARAHQADENDNIKMARTMQNLRLASGEAASIVVHHNRKPTAGREDTNQGVFSMRGAGAIHGEADLVMSLHKKGGRSGPRHSLQFSARNIDEPDEMTLEITPELIFETSSSSERERLYEVFRRIYIKPDSPMLATDLNKHLQSELAIGPRRANDHMSNACKSGYLTRIRRFDGKTEYTFNTSQSQPGSAQ